jgi:hypothetical protein
MRWYLRTQAKIFPSPYRLATRRDLKSLTRSSWRRCELNGGTYDTDHIARWHRTCPRFSRAVVLPWWPVFRLIGVIDDDRFAFAGYFSLIVHCRKQFYALYVFVLSCKRSTSSLNVIISHGSKYVHAYWNIRHTSSDITDSGRYGYRI